MGQRGVETKTEKPQREPIQTPEKFKEKFEEHQTAILKEQDDLFDRLADPVREEERAATGHPALNDIQEWANNFPGSPQLAYAQAYDAELKALRNRQAQALKDKLQAQHDEIETVEVQTNSTWHLHSTIGQMQKRHSQELDTLLKQQETDIKNFFNGHKDRIKNLYNLNDDTMTAKENNLQAITKQSKDNQLKEQREVYKEAKEFTDLAYNFQKQILASKYANDQEILQVAKQGSQFASPPPMRREHMIGNINFQEIFGWDREEYPTLTAAAESESAPTFNAITDWLPKTALTAVLGATLGFPASIAVGILFALSTGTPLYTSNITSGGVQITPTPERHQIALFRAFYKASAELGVEADTERWLLRNPDWSKPAVIKGQNSGYMMAMARVLARNGYDPDPDAGRIRFEELQLSKEELNELRKIYQKWVEKQSAINPTADKIRPFEIKGVAQTHVQMQA